jgi:hypothetical protein
MADQTDPSSISREVIERRGGHTSGSKPYASLPEVSTRPAVGASVPLPISGRTDMSASDPLIQFIRDRLDEDEQGARYSGPHRVGWATYLRPDGSMGYTSPVAESIPGHGDWWVADGKETKPDSVQVVYDPARVLRGVEAKRQIVDWLVSYGKLPHQPASKHYLGDMGVYQGLLMAAKWLASEWSDHEFYQEEWQV